MGRFKRFWQVAVLIQGFWSIPLGAQEVSAPSQSVQEAKINADIIRKLQARPSPRVNDLGFVKHPDKIPNPNAEPAAKPAPDNSQYVSLPPADRTPHPASWYQPSDLDMHLVYQNPKALEASEIAMKGVQKRDKAAKTTRARNTPGPH